MFQDACGCLIYCIFFATVCCGSVKTTRKITIKNFISIFFFIAFDYFFEIRNMPYIIEHHGRFTAKILMAISVFFALVSWITMIIITNMIDPYIQEGFLSPQKRMVEIVFNSIYVGCVTNMATFPGQVIFILGFYLYICNTTPKKE